MKNKLYLFLLFIFFGVCAHAQIAYYDAVELSKHVKNSKFEGDNKSLLRVAEILKKYCIKLNTEVNFDDIVSVITNNTPDNPNYNPILAPYFSEIDQNSASGLITSGKSLFAAAGNLNVTNFADGLAKFLVERSKEELNVAFFRKFQEFLKGYPEVKVIFPTTYNFLKNIYSYQYAAMLPALKAGFQKDMNAFSGNFINLRELKTADCPITDQICIERMEKLYKFLNKDIVGKTFVAALIVSDNLIKGNNAAEILDAIAADSICANNNNFSNIIRFSNLISNSLLDTSSKKIWVGKTELNKLFENHDTFKLYLGLLYAKDKLKPTIFRTQNHNNITLAKLLENASYPTSDMTDFITALKRVGYAAANVSASAVNINLAKDNSEQASIIIYADYATSISEFLKSSVSFFNAKNSKLAKDVHMFTSIIDAAVNSCYDIKSQNYSALVLHTSELLTAILDTSYTFKDDYIKYGTFMANIIEAKSSDEVKAAIEAAVLPIGSSSIKRETNMNISLNAFIGPFAGGEYLPVLKENRTAFVAGLTAPVGVAFSWGNIGKTTTPATKEKGGKSFTIFVPLIDVGAMASFRLGDSESKVASEVKLKNIVSPGLFFYWGFGKCPISLGAGAQVGPQLREVTTTNVNTDKNFYVRFGINLVVDIPLLNFFTRN